MAHSGKCPKCSGELLEPQDEDHVDYACARCGFIAVHHGSAIQEARRIDIGGCTIHCELGGDGPPLALVHDGAGGKHDWFHPHFSHAHDFATVVYYDQRACGRSTGWQPGPQLIERHAEDLELLRAKLGFERWVVLGHSYGSVIAQCYALAYPNRLSGLVLAGTKTREDMQDRFHEFPLPILIIEGQQDDVVTSDTIASLKRFFPTAEFVMIEDAGHDVYAGNPDSFFPPLRAFVGRCQ